MRIGIVCYPSMGGSGILATSLGSQLASRGHEVHFIAYSVPFRLSLDQPNVFFHEVGIYQYELFPSPDYALNLTAKIVEVCLKHSLDVLHVHYAIPHATSAYLAQQILGDKRPAVVTTLHGTDISLVGRDPSYFSLVKHAIEQSQGVTAVSASLREMTQVFFGVQRDIEVIPNFCTPREDLLQDITARKRQLVGEGEALLLHASNFRAIKRVQDVVAIFALVREKVKCKLALLGSGSTLEEVRNQVSLLHLDPYVLFLGKAREVDLTLASADLFLLPSAHESFGLAALEAMAYGVPVIASRIGGLPEWIDHGKTGFLAPVGEVGEMADYAVRLLTDRKLYERMSREGRKKVRERFSTEKVVPQYEAFYEKVIGA